MQQAVNIINLTVHKCYDIKWYHMKYNSPELLPLPARYSRFQAWIDIIIPAFARNLISDQPNHNALHRVLLLPSYQVPIRRQIWGSQDISLSLPQLQGIFRLALANHNGWFQSRNSLGRIMDWPLRSRLRHSNSPRGLPRFMKQIMDQVAWCIGSSVESAVVGFWNMGFVTGCDMSAILC